MFDTTAPDQLACRLQADAYHHLIRTLRLALPRPPGGSAEDVLRRDHAAIASIAALAPGNAVEARIAAQFVAASEQWNEWLRLVQEPDATPEWAATCRARALGMMRQANSALHLVLRLQQVREKREPAGCERAAATEQAALRLMAEALAAQPATPPSVPALQPGPSEAPPGSSPGEAPAEAGPAPAPVADDAGEPRGREHDPELVAAAERCAPTYPAVLAPDRASPRSLPGAATRGPRDVAQAHTEPVAFRSPLFPAEPAPDPDPGAGTHGRAARSRQIG